MHSPGRSCGATFPLGASEVGLSWTASCGEHGVSHPLFWSPAATKVGTDVWVQLHLLKIELVLFFWLPAYFGFHKSQITDWFELEGTLNVFLFHSCHAQGAPSSVQLGLGHLQGRDSRAQISSRREVETSKDVHVDIHEGVEVGMMHLDPVL